MTRARVLKGYTQVLSEQQTIEVLRSLNGSLIGSPHNYAKEAWAATHRAFRPYGWTCLGVAAAFVITLIVAHALAGFITAISILTLSGFLAVIAVLLIGLRAAKKAALIAWPLSPPATSR